MKYLYYHIANCLRLTAKLLNTSAICVYNCVCIVYLFYVTGKLLLCRK